jgi:hypothetical protein
MVKGLVKYFHNYFPENKLYCNRSCSHDRHKNTKLQRKIRQLFDKLPKNGIEDLLFRKQIDLKGGQSQNEPSARILISAADMLFSECLLLPEIMNPLSKVVLSKELPES